MSPMWELPGQGSVHLVHSPYHGRDRDWLLWRQVEEYGGQPWSSLCSGAVPFQPPRHALCDLWLPQPASAPVAFISRGTAALGFVLSSGWWGRVTRSPGRQLGTLPCASWEGLTLHVLKARLSAEHFFPHVIDWEAPSEVLLCLPSAQGTLSPGGHHARLMPGS